MNAQPSEYTTFVKESFLNKKQKVKTGDGKKEIIYLGKIRDKKGNILFYVLTVYSEVQAAIEIHGHSNVLYLSKNKYLERQFELAVQEELPFKLDNNRFYFYYLSTNAKKRQVFVNFVGEQIPKVLCVSPNNCY